MKLRSGSGHGKTKARPSSPSQAYHSVALEVVELAASETILQCETDKHDSIDYASFGTGSCLWDWAVPAVGGWKDHETILRCYQQPDTETMKSVMNEPRKVRDGSV